MYLPLYALAGMAMPHEPDRLRPTLAADNEALLYTPLSSLPGDVQLAEARVEPISVPRPQPFDTVTIGVVTGRPLKLDFAVGEVKSREVVHDDLVLGFENGGKVVLKDYMHAFGLLGDQRTTIIQPDGKHYAFTELLAPTADAKPEGPAANPDVVIIEKPAAGVTRHFKLEADKPAALAFGKSEIAQLDVNRDGELVVTFKDRAALVLEGYAALKGSATLALYDTKGDKVTIGDLAPGAGPDGTPSEGGYLLTPFEPVATPAPLDHLGALAPESASVGAPSDPPESPPARPVSPPSLAEPQKLDSPLSDGTERADDGVSRGGAARETALDIESGAAGLTLIVASGMEIGGDVAIVTGGRIEAPGEAAAPSIDAAAVQRGWIDGHDSGSALARFAATAIASDHGAFAAPAGPEETGQADAVKAGSMKSHEIFDSGDSAPPQSRADAVGGATAAVQDVAALAAHAENQAPQVQNAAQHNVMGHG